MRNLLRSIIKYPIVMLFGLFVLCMLILYLVLPNQSFSDRENRSLQTRPQVSLTSLMDGSFMNKFQTYTTEQLPFRQEFVKCSSLLSRVMLSNESHGIVRGEEGYLFEKTYGIPPQLHKNEQAIENFVSSTDRPVVVAIAPTASEMVSEYLPYGMERINQKEELQEFSQQLERGCPDGKYNMVDIISTLEPHKDQQLYYRTDHHWTVNAAEYGYEAIREALGCSGEMVNITAIPRQECKDFYGTHYAKYSADDIQPDTLTYYEIPITSLERSDGVYDSLYDYDKLNVYDKYAIFLRGNDEICTIEADNGGEGELIVFKDSYANCLIPFLTYDYDRITVVDLRYYADSVSELLSAHPNADILLLYNFSFLCEDNHFYRLTS